MLIRLFRKKAITVTDKRVRTMNEVLTCIKLIKMYAWEESFEKKITGTSLDFFRPGCQLILYIINVTPFPPPSLSFPFADIRKYEKLLLEKAGYTQSLNSSFTTVVPSLATILTFIAHTALRLPLHPSTVSIYPFSSTHTGRHKVLWPTVLHLIALAVK